MARPPTLRGRYRLHMRTPWIVVLSLVGSALFVTSMAGTLYVYSLASDAGVFDSHVTIQVVSDEPQSVTLTCGTDYVFAPGQTASFPIDASTDSTVCDSPALTRTISTMYPELCIPASIFKEGQHVKLSYLLTYVCP